MGLKGELNTICLADIFQNLTLNNKEGTLIIEDPQSRKTFLFTTAGIFVYSEGLERTDLLGPLLVFRELITPMQLDHSMQEVQNTGVFFEDLLMQSSDIDNELLSKIILDCSKEEIYDLFIWKGAQFDFEEGVNLPINIDYRQYRKLTFGSEGVNSILLEAVRRVDEWEAIFKIIPSFEEILIPEGVPLEELLERDSTTQEISPVLKSSQPVKQKVLALLNGRNTIQDVIRKSFLPRFEVCFAITHMLRNGELRTLNTHELVYVADSLTARGLSEQAIHFYLRASQQGGNEPSLMSKLAYAYEQLGQNDRALELHMNYGLFCLQNHQIEEALQSFKRVVVIDPTQTEAREHIYNIYLANPGFPDAKGFDFIQEGISLAEDLKRVGQIEKSNAYLKTCVDQDPSNIQLRQKLIDAYLDSGQKENAINQYMVVAKKYQNENHTEDLIDIYEKILKINRTRSDIQNKLDAILLKKREQKRRRQKKVFKFVFNILILSAVSFGVYREFKAYQGFQEDKTKVLQSNKSLLLTEAKRLLKENKKEGGMLVLAQRYGEFQEDFIQFKKDRLTQLQKAALPYNKTAYGWLLVPREIQQLQENKQEEYPQILERIKSSLNKWFSTYLIEAKQKQLESIDEFRRSFSKCEELFVSIPEINEKNKKLFNSLRKKLDQMIAEKKKREQKEEQKNQEANDILKRAKKYEEQKKFEQAFKTISDFLNSLEYENTKAYKNARIPFRVISNIPAEIFVNGIRYPQVGNFQRKELKKELTVPLKQEELYKIEVKLDGFKTVTKEYTFDRLPPQISVELKKTYIWRTKERLGVIRGTPAIAEDKIIVASSTNRHIYIINARNGSVKGWQNSALGDFSYGAVFDEENQNRFYACDHKGQLKCFSFPDGIPIWSVQPIKGNRKITGPTIFYKKRIPYRGSTYRGVCTSVGRYLFAYAEVDNSFKRIRIKASPKASISSQVVLAKDEKIAYYPTNDGYIRGFNFVRKRPEKSLRITGRSIKIAPLALDNELEILFFGTDNGQFYAVSYRKGLKQLWETPRSLGSSIRGKSLIVEDFVYVGTIGGTIFKIHKTTGDIEWQWPAKNEKRVGAFQSGFCVDDLENIYAGSKDSYLYALDSRGVLKWKYKTDDEIISTPVFNLGNIYFGSKDQYFYAIRR